MKTILGLLLGLTITSGAHACSCTAEIPNARDVLRGSYSVFLGIPQQDSPVVSGRNRTRFTVVNGFKRATNPTTVIYSDIDDGANCGINFKRHEGVLLVQTYREGGRTWANVCTVDTVDPENKELTRLINDLSLLTK